MDTVTWNHAKLAIVQSHAIISYHSKLAIVQSHIKDHQIHWQGSSTHHTPSTHGIPDTPERPMRSSSTTLFHRTSVSTSVIFGDPYYGPKDLLYPKSTTQPRLRDLLHPKSTTLSSVSTHSSPPLHGSQIHQFPTCTLQCTNRPASSLCAGSYPGPGPGPCPWGQSPQKLLELVLLEFIWGLYFRFHLLLTTFTLKAKIPLALVNFNVTCLTRVVTGSKQVTLSLSVT